MTGRSAKEHTKRQWRKAPESADDVIHTLSHGSFATLRDMGTYFLPHTVHDSDFTENLKIIL